MIDLDAYFERIGLSGPMPPTLATLNALTAAHVQAIPFENLDVLLGRPIDLTPAALADKLVGRGRGGYCFEQNGLLLEVLLALGFQATGLSARVRYQRPRGDVPPRTHLFVRVDLDGEAWAADVGVGGLSMTSAIRLDVEDEQRTPHEPRRIVREGDVLFNQVRFGEDWHDVYEFTGEAMPPIDRIVANWFTSAHPESHFKNRLVVARALPDGGRISILNRVHTRRDRDGASESTTLGSPAELLAILAEDFGLVFPSETTFPCFGLDWSQ